MRAPPFGPGRAPLGADAPALSAAAPTL